MNEPDALATLLTELDLKYSEEDGRYAVAFETEHFKNFDGHKQAGVVIEQIPGNTLVTRIPHAYDVSCAYPEAFYTALLQVQWASVHVRFVHDVRDGELSPCVVLPLFGQEITREHLELALCRLLNTVDDFHDYLLRARDSGTVSVPFDEETGRPVWPSPSEEQVWPVRSGGISVDMVSQVDGKQGEENCSQWQGEEGTEVHRTPAVLGWGVVIERGDKSRFWAPLQEHAANLPVTPKEFAPMVGYDKALQQRFQAQKDLTGTDLLAWVASFGDALLEAGYPEAALLVFRPRIEWDAEAHNILLSRRARCWYQLGRADNMFADLAHGDIDSAWIAWSAGCGYELRRKRVLSARWLYRACLSQHLSQDPAVRACSYHSTAANSSAVASSWISSFMAERSKPQRNTLPNDFPWLRGGQARLNIRQPLFYLDHPRSFDMRICPLVEAGNELPCHLSPFLSRKAQRH